MELSRMTHNTQGSSCDRFAMSFHTCRQVLIVPLPVLDVRHVESITLEFDVEAEVDDGIDVVLYGLGVRGDTLEEAITAQERSDCIWCLVSRRALHESHHHLVCISLASR